MFDVDSKLGLIEDLLTLNQRNKAIVIVISYL